MQIAFVIFDGMTTLDFVGVYDPLTRLKTMGFCPDLEWEICALTPAVHDSTGLGIAATKVGESLGGYDLVVIPGGFSTRKLINDQKFIDWIATAQMSSTIATVCSGSLLIGAAGLLKGLRATTHPSAYDTLKPYCVEVLQHRVIDEGNIVTARGVTSALDLGLYLCERYAGVESREKIQRQMDYKQE